MNAEIYDEVAYLYDGSVEGLLTALFSAYARHENPTDITTKSRYQPRLGQHAVAIETNAEQALRVERGLCRVAGNAAFEAVVYAALSDDDAAGVKALRFVRHCMAPPNRAIRRNAESQNMDGQTAIWQKAGSRPSRSNEHRPSWTRRYDALSDITHPAVAPLYEVARAVGNERHRMLQFIRFQELEGGLWFARCNPSASVVPLVMGHFAARLNIQPFIIFDENHRLAGVWDRHTWYLVPDATMELPAPCAREREMAEAWRVFYRRVAIDSRYNPELRRQFMPKRLWKNLTEMQTEDFGRSDAQLPSAIAQSLPTPMR